MDNHQAEANINEKKRRQMNRQIIQIVLRTRHCYLNIYTRKGKHETPAPLSVVSTVMLFISTI